jgi:hypothetical protein
LPVLRSVLVCAGVLLVCARVLLVCAGVLLRIVLHAAVLRADDGLLHDCRMQAATLPCVPMHTCANMHTCTHMHM